MKKIMDELNFKLKKANIPSEERNAICAYYQEHITEKLNNGESIEDIITTKDIDRIILDIKFNISSELNQQIKSSSNNINNKRQKDFEEYSDEKEIEKYRENEVKSPVKESRYSYKKDSNSNKDEKTARVEIIISQERKTKKKDVSLLRWIIFILLIPLQIGLIVMAFIFAAIFIGVVVLACIQLFRNFSFGIPWELILEYTAKVLIVQGVMGLLFVITCAILKSIFKLLRRK